MMDQKAKNQDDIFVDAPAPIRIVDYYAPERGRTAPWSASPGQRSKICPAPRTNLLAESMPDSGRNRHVRSTQSPKRWRSWLGETRSGHPFTSSEDRFVRQIE